MRKSIKEDVCLTLCSFAFYRPYVLLQFIQRGKKVFLQDEKSEFLLFLNIDDFRKGVIYEQ